jgi:hypothetical protein
MRVSGPSGWLESVLFYDNPEGFEGQTRFDYPNASVSPKRRTPTK